MARREVGNTLFTQADSFREIYFFPNFAISCVMFAKVVQQ